MTMPTDEPRDAGADRPEAVLLVGPSGAGKTPLGECLQAGGLWGRACAHFDFGRTLRACARGEAPAEVTPHQCALVRRMLETDALLAEEDFPLAERLVRAFLEGRGPNADTLIVLNGLPRHGGQAGRMARLVRMRALVHLRCTERTVLARVRRDTGGDRRGRDDDLPARLRRKLAVYRERTEPLLDYYRERGVRVIPLDVGAATTAEAMRAELERHPPP